MVAVQSLLESIATSSTVPVYYRPNTGNAGDSLINMGFFELARRTELKYEFLHNSQIETIPAASLVIIGGGGSLVPEWSSTPAAVAALSKRGVRLIILPQSIRGMDNVIEGLPSNSIVFCRENYSLEYCRATQSKAEFVFDHDMAFHADFAGIMAGRPSPPAWNAKSIVRQAGYVYHLLASSIKPTLYAFRCDKELNAGMQVPRRMLNDISSVARFGAATHRQCLTSAHRFLHIIDRYPVVHTDRLHVGIAAAVLGKDTSLYENNYFKIRGVYEASLKTYPNVKLVPL